MINITGDAPDTFDPQGFGLDADLPEPPLFTGPLDVLGTIYDTPQIDAEGKPAARTIELPGWHVNAPWPIAGWQAWRVTPASPRRVFGGGVTVHYTFADQAQFLAALHKSDLSEQPELPPLQVLKQESTRAIDARHESVLLQLTGNPTQAEQTTWAGKVALAEAIQQGLPLSAAQSGFLAAMGVPAAGRAQYAQTVLAKSAMYWQLVGVADKVRSDCKDRIASAATHDALAQAGVQNRAQLERALAAVGARPAQPVTGGVTTL